VSADADCAAIAIAKTESTIRFMAMIRALGERAKQACAIQSRQNPETMKLVTRNDRKAGRQSPSATL
jgi:hypothetical protein